MSFINTNYFKRTLKYISEETKNAFTFKPEIPKKLFLYDFKTVESLQDFIVGSDADIGGYSEAYWGLTPQKTGIFWGKLNQDTSGTNLDKSGYVGLRSKERNFVLFHRERIDVSLFRYLEIHAKGDDKLWMINIITEGMYPTVIWQHRLKFKKPGEFEIVRVPFRDFVRTSHGFVQQKQLEMDKSKIKSIGFSCLKQSGDFSLELKEINAVNSDYTFGDWDIVKNPVDGPKIKWF